jgi:hypothetical protein
MRLIITGDKNLMKKCIMCNEYKNLNSFCKDKTRKDGLNNKCKLCAKLQSKTFRDKNKKYKKLWSEKNKEKENATIRKYRKTLRILNPDKIRDQKRKETQRRKNRRTKILILILSLNPKIIEKIQKEIEKKEIFNKLRDNIRSRMHECLGKNKGGKSWKRLVGYSVEELKKHIEKQFKPGMSWEKRSDWHIDHIVPISAFNFEKPEDKEFKKCWALKNLQPLWKIENLKKNNKLENVYK